MPQRPSSLQYYDDLTPDSRSQGQSEGPSSLQFLDEEPEPREPLDDSFGSGYGIPSLRDIYSTALKIPGQLIETGVGAVDYLSTPWRSMAPGVPSLGKTLRENTSYDPEKWEREISEQEDSERLKNARQELGQSEGFVDSFNSYWRNPGLAALDVEASAIPMYIGGALGRGVKTVAGLGPLISGAIGEGGLTAAQQTADITREKGDFRPEDFLPVTASAAATAGISGVGGRVANRLGLPDVEQMLADPTRKGTKRALPLLGSALTEGLLEEAPQSYQEKVATNYATGKPLTEGAGSAAASGAVSGFVMGGGMPMFRGGPPKPTPDRYAGTNETDEIYDEDTEAVGATFEVPEADVTGDFIKAMRDNGFVQAGQRPGGKTVFRRVNSPDEGGETIPPAPPINEDLPLNQEVQPTNDINLQYNAPRTTPAPVLEVPANELTPEIRADLQTAGYVHRGTSSDGSTTWVQPAAPTQEPYVPDDAQAHEEMWNNLPDPVGERTAEGQAAAGVGPDLVPTNDVGGLRVQNGIDNIQQTPDQIDLASRKDSYDWERDDRATPGVDPAEVNEIFARLGLQGQVRDPSGNPVALPPAPAQTPQITQGGPELLPPEGAMIHHGETVEFATADGGTFWVDKISDPARIRELNAQIAAGQLDIIQKAGGIDPRNVTPSRTGLQQVGNAVSGEIINPTEGPGSPGWQDNITSSTGDIERALNSAGPIVAEVPTPVTEATPAKQTVIIRKGQLTPQMLGNLNRSGYVEVGKTSDGSSRFEKEVVQGPSVSVEGPKADDLQRQVDAFEKQGQPDKAYRALTADSPRARLRKGETWRGRAEAEIARLRVQENPPSMDAAGEAAITPEIALRHPSAIRMMAAVKELDARGAPDSEYRNITSSMSRMVLKKGDTWRNVVLGLVDYFESRVAPDAGSASIKAFDPRIGSGVGQSFEKALRDATDEDLVRMEELMVEDVDKARAHLERVKTIPNMSGVAKRRVAFAESKLTTIKLEQEIRIREAAKEIQFENDDERAFVTQYTAENIAEMRVPGVNPKTGMHNIAMGGADPAVLDMLGTSLYNRDAIATSIKELGQNAADERKISGNKNPIRIVFSEYAEIPGVRDPNHGGKVYGKAIVVKDFGRGLTADQLYTIFTDVGKSGKRDETNASGGFGFAKAAPMLGGLHVKVESIVNENGKLVAYEFEGDPKQMKDQVVGVPLHRTEITWKAKTGFEVTVYFPQTASLDKAKGLWKTTIENSSGMDNVQSLYAQSSVDWDDDIPEFLDKGTVSNPKNVPHITEHKSLPTPNHVDTINLPTANVKVHYDLDDKERTEAQVIVLNNGLFALTYDHGYGRTPLPNVPEKIVLDINSLVPEGTTGYPFGLNREDMNDDLKNKLYLWIEENITKPGRNQKNGEVQKLFDDLKPASPHHQHVLHDSGDRMTPREKAEFNNSPHVREVASIMGKMLDELRNHFSFAQKNAAGDTVAFGFMQADSKSGGLNIPNPSITGWRDAKEYKILINLMGLIQDAPSPGIAAEKIAHVILHEFNHNRVRPEGAQFTWALLETDSTYTAGRRADIVEEIYAAITGPDGSLAPGIRKLLQSYTEQRGRPDTTVDTLSRQRALEWIREPEGQEGVPSDGERDGKKATPRAIEVLRKALPVVNTYEKTRFILPDGTRLGFDPKKPQYHDEQTHALGIRLAEAQEAGIIRFRDHMAEVHGPISGEQATHLADSTWNSESTTNPFIVVDVLTPSGGRTHETFGENDSPRKIRNWVNKFFQDFEKGWTDAKSGSTTGALFGGMPFKQAWGGVKQATGWGMGGQMPPPPPVVPGQPTQKPVHWVKEALAVPAGLTTTADLSAPWRQGLGQVHTPQFWKAVVPMLKAGFSEQVFNTIDADLRSKPVMLARRHRTTGKVMPSIATEAGLKMFESASSNAPMGQRAQATASRWIEQGIGTGIGSRIWKNTAGVPIRASNRAYITFLNHLKVNRFEYLMDQSAKMHIEARNTGFARPGFFKQAYTAQEAKDLNGYRNKVLAKELADFVNTATGQGPLKTHVLPFRQTEVSLESAAGALQHLFFSPGLIASRVRMLNPSTYIMASPQVRMQYLQSALATGAAWMAALALIKGGGGDEVEVNLENMTSADWAKAKIGDTRMDPGGGFQQFMVAMARMIQGGTTSSASNDWREFGEGFNAPTQKGNIERFLSNKFNPVTKFAYDLASQSEYNPFHVKDRVAQLFVPLVIQDLIGLYYENPKMLPWMAPIMLGMGTQTYGRGESVGKLVAPENDWLATGGGLRDVVTTEDENF